MQLYDILNPQLFKPLSGRNQWIFADLLMLIWDHCRMSTDYGMGKNEMIRLTEDYLEGAGLEMTELDSGEQAEENEQPTSRDLHGKTVWCSARLRNCGWLEYLEIGYHNDTDQSVHLHMTAAPPFLFYHTSYCCHGVVSNSMIQ